MKGKLNLTRRNFLKVSALAGASASMGALPAVAIAAPPMMVDVSAKKVRSCCTVECLHHNLTAHVVNNKVVNVVSSPDNDTKACARGISRAKYLYNPKRVLYPMLQTGEKGNLSTFKKISWNEAFDLIEKNLKNTIKKFGNKAIYFSSMTGNMDSTGGAFGAAFFNRLGGYTTRSGSMCCGVISYLMPQMLGQRYVDTRDTVADSKYLLCWGNNPVVTLQAYYKNFVHAMDKGAKMVTIDPRYSETAAKSDEWVQIIPGTDAALALGMLNHIIKNKLYDEKFLLEHSGATYLVDKNGDLIGAKDHKYMVWDSQSKKAVPFEEAQKPALSTKGIKNADTTVFDLIAAEAAKWTPQAVEKETSVPAKMVTKLANDYATIKPAMIVQNMGGFQRTQYGGMAVMAQFYLAAFTGNYGKPGSGILDAGGVTQFPVKFNPVIPSKDPNIPAQGWLIPQAETGRWINEGRHPINFMWFMTYNPAAQLPNSNEVIRAMKKVPFVVVADNTFTDSCKYANLVLPAASIFEFESVIAGIRSHYVQLMEKAVEPIGEAKPDTWIFTQLAKRFGFGEAFDKPMSEHINTILKGSGITYEQLKMGPVKPVETPWVPFKDGYFTTPTKRIHLFVQQNKDKFNEPAIATYKVVEESPKGNPALAGKFPLMAVHKKTVRTVHTSFSAIEELNEATTYAPVITVNTADAAARNIKYGDEIVVFNDRGEHRGVADVSEHVMKGVVVLENGWSESFGGSSSSCVSNDAADALVSGQSNNSTLVNVRRA